MTKNSMIVYRCPECGEYERSEVGPARWIRRDQDGVVVHFHRGDRERGINGRNVPAEEIEVVPTDAPNVLSQAEAGLICDRFKRWWQGEKQDAEAAAKRAYFAEEKLKELRERIENRRAEAAEYHRDPERAFLASLLDPDLAKWRRDRLRDDKYEAHRPSGPREGEVMSELRESQDLEIKALIEDARRALQALEDDLLAGLWFDENIYPTIGRLEDASAAIDRKWAAIRGIAERDGEAGE